MKAGSERRNMGIILVVIADLFWGTVFVVSQVGLQYTDPYTLVFLRFAVSSVAIIFILPFFRRSIHIFPELKNKYLWFLSLIYSLGFILQYVGQDLTSASEATLLSNLSPILIPIFAYFLLKEKLTKYHVVAITLGFFGLILIASPNLTLGFYQLLGSVLLFATSIFYALFTVLSKKNNAVTISSTFAIIFAVTAILALPAIFLGDLRLENLVIAPVGWAAILYLGIPCTLIAITMYMKGLGMIQASEVGILVLLQILVGLVLSVIILGEYLSISQTMGAIAILAALAFVLRPKKRNPIGES